MRIRATNPAVTMAAIAKPWRHARESRHARGYGAAWEKVRAAVLRDEPLCRPCRARGRVTAATAVDHIRPRARGGTDDRENLQPICAACHEAKTLEDRGYAPRGCDADGIPYRRRQR
jgi:5-methylcytosine-specific restriction endonuclease McrA